LHFSDRVLDSTRLQLICKHLFWLALPSFMQSQKHGVSILFCCCCSNRRTAQHSPAARDTLRARCLRRAPDPRQPRYRATGAGERRGWRGGSLRVFRHFAWLEVDSGKMALSRPTHQQVTQAVGLPVIVIVPD